MHRTSSHDRGYDHRWRAARELHLLLHPLCEYCKREGITTAGTVVDHIIPHRGDQTLFWDRDNWQTLCDPHHDGAKQAEEKNGYSRHIAVDGWPTDPRHPSNSGKVTK